MRRSRSDMGKKGSTEDYDKWLRKQQEELESIAKEMEKAIKGRKGKK